MTVVECYVDPSCPWAFLTSRWLLEVASQRDLTVVWRSYCMEIRDDYGVAPTVPEEYREQALRGHALSHRMLRVFEAARASGGEGAVGRLYDEWGARYFAPRRPDGDAILGEVVAAAAVAGDVLAAADDERWDEPIKASMEVAYAFGGPKAQTPTIVVRADPPYGFKGPVMAPAPAGDGALEMWDAIGVLARWEGFFEIARPRVNMARDHIQAGGAVA